MLSTAIFYLPFTLFTATNNKPARGALAGTFAILRAIYSNFARGFCVRSSDGLRPQNPKRGLPQTTILLYVRTQPLAKPHQLHRRHRVRQPPQPHRNLPRR